MSTIGLCEITFDRSLKVYHVINIAIGNVISSHPKGQAGKTAAVADAIRIQSPKLHMITQHAISKRGRPTHYWKAAEAVLNRHVMPPPKGQQGVVARVKSRRYDDTVYQITRNKDGVLGCNCQYSEYHQNVPCHHVTAVSLVFAMRTL